jgi:protease-4
MLLKTHIGTLSALLAVLCVASTASAQLFDFPLSQPQTGSAAAVGPQIAVFALEGSVTEKPGSIDPLFGDPNSESLQSLVRRINEAVGDDDVQAVVLIAGGATPGRAQTEELRAALARLEDAGKPVYAYAESLTTDSYALLCGATRLSVAPTGDVWITGLYGEGLHVRGLLDLLGVEPDFLTCGDYKSAAEMFTRTSPSPQAQEMEDWLYDSIYESLVASIADGRGVEPEKVKEWIDVGLYSAESAKEAGIIDAVEHRADFVAVLRDEHGDDTPFNKSYAEETEPTLDLSNPFAAMSLLMGGPDAMQSFEPEKDSVAIVYVDGAIMLGEPQQSVLAMVDGAYSGPIRRALDQVADDNNVKAVVLRVNSPGGSAIASEIILDAAKRVAEKKPLVVSMGDVAASGGYYVSCGTDTIFADRSTITGSIGVVAGKVATTKMWNRVGIHFHPIQRGRNADILSSAEIFTDDQREALQGWMDEVYGVFKGHVTAARGDKLAKPIDDLAGGRVYTGEQALELGLVDKIGGLDEAISFVAEEAGLEDYEIKTVPEAKSFLETLLASLTGESDEDEGQLRLQSPRLSTAFLEQAGPVLEAADPRRVRLLYQAAQQLDILQQERLSLTMPLMDIHP